MIRRALITGITGFIGGRLASRLLTDGWHVDAIVRSTSDITALPFADAVTFHRIEEGDTLIAPLSAAQPEIVFHLASLYLADHRPEQIPSLLASNILFSTQLLEAMAQTNVRRIINTGTAWQHFEGSDQRSVNLYAATKQAFEVLLDHYVDIKGLIATTLKLYDTFGKRDPRRKLIQLLIDQAGCLEPLPMSPGEQIVDLTHVDDVVAAFLIAAGRIAAVEESRHDRFLISGERHRVCDLAPMIGAAVGKPVTVTHGGRPYRPREVMDPVIAGRADRLPGWNPKLTLVDYLTDASR